MFECRFPIKTVKNAEPSEKFITVSMETKLLSKGLAIDKLYFTDFWIKNDDVWLGHRTPASLPSKRKTACEAVRVGDLAWVRQYSTWQESF